MARGSGLGRKARKRTVGFLTLWDEILSAMVSKNNSYDGILRRENLYCDMKGLYSGENNVSYIYTIDGYPKELENSYRTSIREACKEGVRISFVCPLEKTSIDWNSSQIKAKMRTWKLLEQDGEEVDAYNYHANLLSLDNQEWKKDSLVYLSSADKRRKRKLFRYRTLMIVSGVRGDNFNGSVLEILQVCHNLDIKISRVIGDIPEYLKTFSPFSNTPDKKVFDKCGNSTLPDELLSRFNTYSQGTIGLGGIYWGTDIFSNFPCLKTVKQTRESAENWLITAETGGGKSYFMKCILLQLLAKSEFNGTIMDVEGFEYEPVSDYLSNNDLSVILNMGEGSGAYYDPVEIVVTGDRKLDSDMYNLSVSFTLSLFKCLLGTTNDEDEWVDIVINDAVAMTYAKAGVIETDMSTWHKSKGYSLYNVYETLKTLIQDGDAGRAVNNMFSHSLYEERMGNGSRMTSNDVGRLITTNEGYQQAIEMCIAKVSRYFEPTGIRASIFKKRITIDEVKDAKLVICSFGMAGKADSTVDPIQMALMQLYSANISHLRSIFSRYAGKYNFKLWEEFQRWGGFPNADKSINVALTGGRKLGDINIIVTNNIRVMLEDDKFGVFSNVTTFAIGAIMDANVREELCARLTVPQLTDSLDELAENNKDLSSYVAGDNLERNPLEQNPYKKAFLIGLDRTVFTLCRVNLPRELSQGKIFRTGIDLAE